MKSEILRIFSRNLKFLGVDSIEVVLYNNPEVQKIHQKSTKFTKSFSEQGYLRIDNKVPRILVEN